MKMIVGLGNPGTKYERTRHNVGFMVVDELSHRYQLPWKKVKQNGMVATTMIGTEKVLLVKPLTFMNESGLCVGPLVDYYNLELADLLVIYDDLDLPVGKMRLRAKGSAGGHNGIKSIIQHLGTQTFNRIRIGIDRPRNGEIIHHVLGEFAKAEEPTIIETIQLGANAVEAFTNEPFAEVMNKFN